MIKLFVRSLHVFQKHSPVMMLIIYNITLPCAETGKQIETEREFLMNSDLFELALHLKRVCQHKKYLSLPPNIRF